MEHHPLFSITNIDERLAYFMREEKWGTPEFAALDLIRQDVAKLRSTARALIKSEEALKMRLAEAQEKISAYEASAEVLLVKQLRELADALESGGRVCTENPCYGQFSNLQRRERRVR
jgi:hypothetical protein